MSCGYRTLRTGIAFNLRTAAEKNILIVSADSCVAHKWEKGSNRLLPALFQSSIHVTWRTVDIDNYEPQHARG